MIDFNSMCRKEPSALTWHFSLSPLNVNVKHAMQKTAKQLQVRPCNFTCSKICLNQAMGWVGGWVGGPRPALCEWGHQRPKRDHHPEWRWAL